MLKSNYLILKNHFNGDFYVSLKQYSFKYHYSNKKKITIMEHIKILYIL